MKLNSAVSKSIPASAANLKTPSTQMVGKGTLSEASAAKIRAKANRILGAK